MTITSIVPFPTVVPFPLSSNNIAWLGDHNQERLGCHDEPSFLTKVWFRVF